MATSYAGNANKQPGSREAAGASYQLLITSPNGRAVVDEVFPDWRSLAFAVKHRCPDFDGDPFQAKVFNGCLQAYSTKNKPINLTRLIECKHPSTKIPWSYRVYRGYIRRSTPVPRTGKMRGGYGAYRAIKTRAERRDNHAVEKLEEGGQRLVRAARRDSVLPNLWDDIYRRPDRSWKSQHKGGKSWSRMRSHSPIQGFLLNSEAAL